MGTLFKKKGSKHWQMGVWIAGRQKCKSTHTSNKRQARQFLAAWETEVFEGRYHLVKSKPPRFEQWADEFLSKIIHPNTRKRYAASISKLKGKFAGFPLPEICAQQIDGYKEERLAQGVEA